MIIDSGTSVIAIYEKDFYKIIDGFKANNITC